MVYPTLDAVPAEAGASIVRLPITVDVNGDDIALTIHVLRGAQPGPTLLLLAGLHGNEWLHLHFFRQLVATFDSTATRGTVLVVPMANTTAFGTLSRYIAHDDGDTPDANRAFPGGGRSFTWIAEQLAEALATRVFPAINCLIDFHLGVWGHTMGSTIVGTDYSDPDVSRRSLNLAKAYGAPLIYAPRMLGGWPGPRSSLTYLGERLGVPGLGCFLGGAGFGPELEAQWIADNVRGIRGVMAHLGMLEQAPPLRERYLVYDATIRLNPRIGGLLVPEQSQDTFGRPVQRGERLGTVVSPLTFETLEQLIAPDDGVLSYWARSYPVRPGDYAFGIIPEGRGTNRWVDGALA